MRRAISLCAMLLSGCVGESSVTCGDNVQGGTGGLGACLCNCPDGVPERVPDEGGDYCKDAPDSATCCFWQTEQVLLVGTCKAKLCVVAVKSPP